MVSGSSNKPCETEDEDDCSRGEGAKRKNRETDSHMCEHRRDLGHLRRTTSLELLIDVGAVRGLGRRDWTSTGDASFLTPTSRIG